ncbi:hypothetical protein [Phaeobacter phage MD18]|nr:hypothetical protein [Phaeobacter phage MD18]
MQDNHARIFIRVTLEVDTRDLVDVDADSYDPNDDFAAMMMSDATPFISFEDVEEVRRIPEKSVI